MKCYIHRLSIAMLMAVIIFTLVIVLNGLMSTHRLPVMVQDVIPAAEVADARILIRIISPAIQSTLNVMPNLRVIDVVGHVACDTEEQVRIDVTISQAATGAEAKGHTQDFCTGDVQTWTTRVAARGPKSFTEGSAQACAVAVTRLRGKTTDTYSWCKIVALVK